MVFYRFNHLSQTLKATSAGIFSVSVANGAGSAPKYVYKPFLTLPRAVTAAVAHQSSDHAKHDPGYYVSTKFDGWENWKSWKDVPDHLIPKTSWRDPDNPIYSDPGYIRFRKEQIFIQRPIDLPVYLKNGPMDYYVYLTVVVLTGLAVLHALYGQYQNIYKKYYPDHNLFYFF